MGKKFNRHNKKTFLQRISFKYKVSILNENTLEETFRVHLSRLSVFLYACLFAVISFAVISLVIFYTPIKYFLPGYSDASIRSDLVKKSLELDSLQRVMYFQEAQMTVIKSVLSGSVEVDSVIPIDSIKLEKLAKVLDVKSDAEKQFCKKFEEEEKYTTANVKPAANSEIMVFMKPVSGVISEPYNPTKSYGITFVLSSNAAVKAVQDGTVVAIDYTLQHGYSMVVQHPDGYISVYKNIGQMLKRVGDEVKAGEVLGVIEDAVGVEGKSNLYFELWQKGKTVNPSDYIIF